MKLAQFIDAEIEQLLKARELIGEALDPAASSGPGARRLPTDTVIDDLVNAPYRDAIGKAPLELVLDLATELRDAITTTVTTGQTQHREFHHGLPSCFDCQFVPVFNDRNEIEAVVKTSRDITGRKQTDYQLWRSANFDTLTGLPNQRLFTDRLEQTLLEATRKDSSFALLFIDLDRLQQTSDQPGHEAADRLLALVADRISSRVRAMDTVARLGGKQFTLILKETDRDGAKQAATALLASLERTFEVDSQPVHIAGSIGLTIFPDDCRDAEELMHNADQAMYAAKEHGGQQVQCYEAWMAQSESQF
ncbi:GGDEF domain-containing protein [Marinobacter orientalis]|uniref:GGDEF domain-containing protein n=1 Tax=Marinobacter orientalis TaxID=1928859 RepID=A0A7Y0REU1_9GAMM|nr:GGDEF domain-containing protein [Marinobacter orientalis]NMT64964.1 GGDEF domain-containing protein [Marinobacter orientalis]